MENNEKDRIKLQFIGLPFYLAHRQSASILTTSSACREIGCPVPHLCPVGRVHPILTVMLKPENIETLLKIKQKLIFPYAKETCVRHLESRLVWSHGPGHSLKINNQSERVIGTRFEHMWKARWRTKVNLN